MSIFGLMRGGFLLAMGFVAFGGLLTSTRYALVFQIAVVAALVVAAAALLVVLARAAIVRRRPHGVGVALWAGVAGGLVAAGLLTRPGLTLVVAGISAVVAMGTFLGQRASA
ncbi:hypothetical protein AB0H36_27660 [Kribbella sp. NPDC050820]|uniref:hypothetical protein n=1 Tax=Kribbella sp. NPDC050820 TaxID=3155408 RepID=UPI0033FF69B5